MTSLGSPDAAAPGAASSQSAPVPLSAILRFSPRPWVVTPGELFHVELTVAWWMAAPVERVELVLLLPQGITTPEGATGAVRQSVPPLGYGEYFTNTVALVSTLDAVPTPRVVTLRGGLVCAGCQEIWIERTLGVGVAPVSDGAAPAGGDAARSSLWVDARGGVLQSPDGAVVLLVPPGVVSGDASFHYAELYRWQQAAQPHSAAPGQELSATTTAGRVWLPLVASTGADDGDVAADTEQENDRATTAAGGAPADMLDLALEDNGVWLFSLWQLKAEVGAEPLATFTTPVELLVDLAGWEEAGIALETLSLWTRETSEAPWTLVPSHLEEDVLSAELLHFSEYGLGAALTTSGDRPPSMQMFTVDQFTGSANAVYAIDTPTGLGGLRPNLAFAYASSSQDDLVQEGGNWQIVTQASSVGAGWRLDGINYIARIGSKLSLVLNGKSANIVLQDGVWRTAPALFARLEWAGSGITSGYGQWVVTTTDGVRYEFGDGGSTPDGFVATSATALMLEQTGGGTTYRQAKRWYLRRVVDTHGNVMAYNYAGERGSERGCVDEGWVNNNHNWYTRALDPTEILWSRNDAAGVGEYKMRVRFVYDRVNKRQDVRIKGNADSDCIQAVWGEYNQLKEVRVEVLTNGAWRTLRAYQLQHGYQRFTTENAGGMIRLYLTDITQLGARNGVLSVHSYTYDMVNANRIMLRTANNGQGGAITYTYGVLSAECPSGVCPNGSGRLPVMRSDLADGLGGSIRTDYWYGPGFTANDGGFRGFSYVEITHYDVVRSGAGGSVLKWEKLETFGGHAGWDRYNPDPRRGRVRRQTIKRDGWTPAVLAVYEYDWQVQWWKSGVWQPVLPQYTWSQAANSAQWIRQEAITQTVGGAVNVTRYAFQPERQNGSQFGNVTEAKEYGDGALLRTTVTEYFPNVVANVVNQPARVTVYDAQGACVAETRTVYGAYFVNGVSVSQVNDTYTQPPLNTTLVKRERPLRGGCTTAAPIATYDPDWAITRYAYDAVGNEIAVNQVGEESSGVKDLVIQTVYDSIYRLFPVEQSYSKFPAHKEMATYYGVNGLSVDDSKAYWGAVQEQCGVNERCTRQTYDEFGRITERWELVSRGAAWGDAATADVRWMYPAWGQGGLQRYVVAEWRAPRCFGNFVRRIYDGLGQLAQEQRAGDTWEYPFEGCGVNRGPLPEIDVDYLYDGLGRQMQASAPHATTLPWVNRAADWSQGYQRIDYDALGRQVRLGAMNGGIVETQYSGRQTMVVGRGRFGDGDKVLSWTETDGAGNLLRVRTWSRPPEQGGGVEGEVRLTHDALGNLTRVALPSGGVATMSYDMGGRKVAMDDPDLGEWLYAYDRQGKLVRQRDARWQTTCLYYDVIGRLAGKDLDQGSMYGCATTPTYELIYTYDGGHSASKGSRGQLTQVRYADGSYTRNLTYNSKGLLASESVSIGGAAQSYTTSYGYDMYNRPVTTIYPDGEMVTVSGFTGRGLPTTLRSTFITLVNDVAYDVAGRQVGQRYPAGGNVQRMWSYAPFNQADNNGGMLTSMVVTQADGQQLLDFGYGYDSFGNLKQHNDSVSGWWTFHYDAQNRLSRAYERAYAYDGAGRMTDYEGSARNYTGADPVHAVKNSGYGYDANGNLLQRPGLALAWNAENRLERATVGWSIGESYTYDDGGIRVKKVSNGVTTYYPFPHYEVQVSGSVTTTTKYYFFGGQRIAMQRGSDPLTYLYGDRLNSTVLATRGGTTNGQERYYAYGKDRFAGSTVPTDNRFTGQKEDGTGLVYMNARYYDPVTGQFVSPDTLVPDATNLFDYNRYMYARGNPLKYTDPSGHCSTIPPTPGDEDALAEFTACWQTAATILNMYDSDSWWQERFRVSRDEWIVNIGANSSTDSAWMQSQLDAWESDFTLRTGLPHPERPVVWPDPPPHPLESACNTWDCPAVAMDAGSLLLSASGDAVLIGCAVATEGACIFVGLGLKAVDVTMTGISAAYSFDQYYNQGTASDADLAIALTDLLGILPGVGEASGVLSLGWDLADPWIDDESNFPHGAAK